MLTLRIRYVRAFAAWSAGVALSATALASCTDVREPTTVIPGKMIAPLLNRSRAINMEVPRFPEPVEFIPELPVSDLETFRDLSDVELIESVRRANGVVSIGLKPVVAARTSQSGKLPAMTRAEILAARATLEQNGVRVVRTFRNLGALVAEITPEAAPAIRSLPVVNYISAPSRGHLLGAFAPAFVMSSTQDTGWGTRKIRAPTAWTLGERGQQSSVTILDTGLDSTRINSGDGPAGNIDCRYVVTNTCHWTVDAHGTYVAGLIAARDNAQGVIGVANQLANFASIKIMKDNGEVWSDDFNAGLDEAISFGYSRHIVNMSIFFCTADSDMDEAVQRTKNAGILMIANGGNTWQCSGDPVPYPGRYADVIAVSGTTEDDTFWKAPRLPCGSALGSVSGPPIEISAPFWDSTMAGTGQYYWGCGNSLSTPLVTGVAALAWTKYPTLTAAQLRTHLQGSVLDLGPDGRDWEFGYGRIDAARAVGYVPPPPPLSVTISGPSTWPAYQVVTVQASVSGGTSPYSYAWLVNGAPYPGCGNQSWCDKAMGAPGTSVYFRVTVTDSQQRQTSDDHIVFAQ